MALHKLFISGDTTMQDAKILKLPNISEFQQSPCKDQNVTVNSLVMRVPETYCLQCGSGIAGKNMDILLEHE